MIRTKGIRATVATALTLTTCAGLAACGGGGGSSAGSSAPVASGTRSTATGATVPAPTTSTPAKAPTATSPSSPPASGRTGTTPAPSSPSRKTPSKPVTSAKVVAALTKFAACMRANKVNVPPPNTSGKGPIFDLKGVDTASPQFRAALRKCASTFSGFLKVHPDVKVTPRTTPLVPPTTNG